MNSKIKEKSDIDKKNYEKEQFRIKQAVSLKIFKAKIWWNKKKKTKFL